MWCCCRSPIAIKRTKLPYFLYDSNGQRVRAKFQQNDATPLAYQHSLYQGLNLISQYDVDSNNQLSINANYQFHPLQRLFIGREPFAESNTDNNTQTFFHTDALGSILATSKRNQTIAARYDYDAWGNEIHNTGTSDNPLGYTGHQMDRDIGLIYANARYLDPDTGRFLSFDPFEGYDDKPISLNKYLYAYQNPLKYTDPTGRVPVLDETGKFLTDTAGRLINQAETADSALSAIAFGVGAGANYVVGGVVETVNFGLNIVAADGWLGNGVKDRASRELDEAFNTIQTIIENPKGTAVAIAGSMADVAAGVSRGEHKAYAQAAATVTSLATGKPNTSVTSAARSVTQTTAHAARVSAQLAQKVIFGVKEFAQTLADNAMSPSRGQMFGQRGAAGDIGAGVAKGPQVFRNLAPADEIGSAVLFPASQIQKVSYSRRLNYVVTQSGELVIGRTGHISLSQGADVLAAGEARFVNGVLRAVDNASGHYKPSGASAQGAAEAAFGRAGFDAAGKYVERRF